MFKVYKDEQYWDVIILTRDGKIFFNPSVDPSMISALFDLFDLQVTEYKRQIRQKVNQNEFT